MYDVGNIYRKYINGDAFSDEELEQGIWFFEQITKDLESLGPSFHLSANETRRVLFGLESFKRAREERK